MRTPARFALAALALCAGALAAVARAPVPPLAADEVSAVELAGWIRARQPGLVIVDLGSTPAAQALPGARRASDLDGSPVDTVVVYGGQGETAPMRFNARRVLRLHGGIEAWNAEVISPAIRADAPEHFKREFAERARLSRYFGGSPRVLDPGAKAPRVRSRRGC